MTLLEIARSRRRNGNGAGAVQPSPARELVRFHQTKNSLAPMAESGWSALKRRTQKATLLTPLLQQLSSHNRHQHLTTAPTNRLTNLASRRGAKAVSYAPNRLLRITASVRGAAEAMASRAHHRLAQSLLQARQRIGRTAATTHSPSCAWLSSVSCSENYAIPHELTGQTLSKPSGRSVSALH